MKGFFTSSEIKFQVSSTIPRCGACGLYKGCLSPKMKPYGKGRRRVLVVGEAPGETEDRLGRPFVGQSGQLLREVLDEIGVDLDEDCLTTNAIICRPPRNATPTPQQISYCHPNLKKTIEKFQPEVVITLGKTALESVLMDYWKSDIGTMERWVGWKIPLPDFWLCPTYHPSYLLRDQHPVLRMMFREHLENAFLCTRKKRNTLLNPEKRVKLLYDEDAIRKELKEFCKEKWVAIDYETNSLKPEWEKSRIYSVALSSGERTISFLYTDSLKNAMLEFITSPVKKIACNLKFEERWTKKVFGVGMKRWAWDTMIAAHVLDNRPGITSIKFQAFVRLGVPTYNEHIEPLLQDKGKYNRIQEIPVNELLLYGGIDALVEYYVAEQQREELGYED